MRHQSPPGVQDTEGGTWSREKGFYVTVTREVLGTPGSAFLLRQQQRSQHIYWNSAVIPREERYVALGDSRTMLWSAGESGWSGKDSKIGSAGEPAWPSVWLQCRWPMLMPLPAAALQCQWDWPLSSHNLYGDQKWAYPWNAISSEGRWWGGPLFELLPGYALVL